MRFQTSVVDEEQIFLTLLDDARAGHIPCSDYRPVLTAEGLKMEFGRYSEWTSLWPYAVLLIGFGAWAVYHFLAPSNWRDWAGAGLLQAFVISLYAEMYGFPLTIYLLTGLLPLEIPLVHSSGHLWATLMGYGRSGAVVMTMISSIFIVTGLLLIVKGWVRVYFFRGRVLTEGVYGLIRHPQYMGIFLVVFGQLLDWPTIATVILAPAIICLYINLAKREERTLIERFGGEYFVYRERVPMFIPDWRRLLQA